MFVEGGAIDTALLQGDIVSSVHILGAINLNAVQYSETPAAIGEASYQSWQVPSAPQFMDAMVLSHSCEIAIENRVKLTSIILAPIRDVHTATAPDCISDLIASNLIDRDEPQATFLKYFYVDPNPNMQFGKGAIVDFSKCFSVRKQSYNLLLDKKIVQLKEKARASMALKLSLYFYRRQEPLVA